MGYKTVGRGRDSNKLRLHLESKNRDYVSFISNTTHHYSNKSCSNSFNCHNKFKDNRTGGSNNPVLMTKNWQQDNKSKFAAGKAFNIVVMSWGF